MHYSYELFQSTTVPPANMTGGEVEVVLPIDRPTDSDEGNYTCIAENMAGSVSVSRIVDVRSETLLCVCVCVVSEHYTPDIQPPLSGAPPARLTHLVGDTVVLECPVEGLDLEPGFTLSWERNGDLPRDRVEFLCNNMTLVLRDADISDVDSYTCVVLEPSGRTFRFDTLLTLFSELLSPDRNPYPSVLIHPHA